jgi:hypothetical protein
MGYNFPVVISQCSENSFFVVAVVLVLDINSFIHRRMLPSGMLHRVALVRTEVSEECVASIISVTRISELGTTLAVSSNLSTLRINVPAKHRF